MKIQFVVVGWYYNQDTLQEGLKSLNDNNDEINVFSYFKHFFTNGTHTRTTRFVDSTYR